MLQGTVEFGNDPPFALARVYKVADSAGRRSSYEGGVIGCVTHVRDSKVFTRIIITNNDNYYNNISIMSVKTSNNTHIMANNNQRTARRVLKKYRVVARRAAAADSYWRLKKLVPTIKSKDNISQLDVVLEAISYIQRLQGNLEASLLDGTRQF